MKKVLAMIVLMAAETWSGAQESRPKAPEGWLVYSTGHPEDSVRRCANFSKREWSVSLEGETPHMAKGTSSRRVVRMAFDNGWLHGVDAGEFGGGLWWDDAAARTKIFDDNVRGIVRTSFGTLVLTGLEHMGMRSGKIFRIVSANPTPSATMLADLGEAPWTSLSMRMAR